MPDPPGVLLEWDSRFFGRRIGRVAVERLTAEDLGRVMAWGRGERLDCLYFLCPSDDDDSVAAAEAHGFHLTDVRVELSWRAATPAAPAPVVRAVRESDLAELRHIARTAHGATRFAYDRHFARERVAALYEEWITRSCQGHASAVLVADAGERVAGYVTCHLDGPDPGRIGLLGVGVEARGTGMGRALVEAAQRYFVERGVSEVRVVTQGRNIAAQRLYQASGFRTAGIRLWYHMWLSGDEGRG